MQDTPHSRLGILARSSVPCRLTVHSASGEMSKAVKDNLHELSGETTGAPPSHTSDAAAAHAHPVKEEEVAYEDLADRGMFLEVFGPRLAKHEQDLHSLPAARSEIAGPARSDTSSSAACTSTGSRSDHGGPSTLSRELFSASSECGSASSSPRSRETLRMCGVPPPTRGSEPVTQQVTNPHRPSSHHEQGGAREAPVHAMQEAAFDSEEGPSAVEGRVKAESRDPEADADSLPKSWRDFFAAIFVDEDEEQENIGMVSPMSLGAKLPSGHLFGSIARMRTTINTYSSALAQCGWWESFKQPTIKALERRLAHHEPQIVGNFHSSAELGFKQLQCRVRSLLRLHKAIGTWNEAQVYSKLVDILKPLKSLLRYLRNQELRLAADLAVLTQIAIFHHMLLVGNSSIADALMSINRFA